MEVAAAVAEQGMHAIRTRRVERDQIGVAVAVEVGDGGYCIGKRRRARQRAIAATQQDLRLTCELMLAP